MTKKSYPLSKVYGLLEPGPVVLLTTADHERPNIMTLSWHTMIEFEPPLIGCVISNRNHSFDLLMVSRECVINIPSQELAEKVVGCGNTSGAGVDKFERFSLTPTPAAQVDAPLIEECFANLECRVVDTTMVAKYGLFVVEVVKAWIDPAVKEPRTIHHLGHGDFMVAGERIRLKSKMK
jgi:flavin reductase (DIM6/NTAB) family NADH-FMN oxidoreductase RutF